MPLGLRVGYLLILPSLAAGTSLASDERALEPNLRAGDTWSYTLATTPSYDNPAVRTDRYTFVVKSRQPNYYAVAYTGPDANGNRVSQERRWSLSTNFLSPRPDGGGLQELLWFQWPLEPGKTWQSQWLSPYGESRLRFEVRGWEVVSVPAGTFRAARIEMVWEGGLIEAGGMRVEKKQTVWYAPETRRYVKFEEYVYASGYLGGHRVDELMSFQLRP